MSPLFQTIIAGVISGIVASAIFLFIISRFKPKIEISPYIAVKKTSDGQTVYKFKFINRTHRDIINVRARLVLSKYINVSGGPIINNERLQLKTSEIFQIGKFDKKDKDANYAWRLVCYEDLDEIWHEGNGNHLKLRIIATDSLTGFSKTFIKKFHLKREAFIEGSHRFGDALDVI